MARGRKTGGRPKGALNKENKALREMILGALDRGGGENWLLQQMTDQPNAFLSLIGRVLPMTINGPGDGGEHQVILTWQK